LTVPHFLDFTYINYNTLDELCLTVNTKNSKYVKFWINFCGLKVGAQSKDNLKSKPDRWKNLEPVAVNLWKNDRATTLTEECKILATAEISSRSWY